MKDVDIKSEIKKTVNYFIGSFHHIYVKIIIIQFSLLFNI